MKSLYTTLIAVLISVILIQAQTAEEVINKHLDAYGGKAKTESVKTMKITGQFTAFSLEKPFETLWFGPDAYYSSLSLGKFDVVQVYNKDESRIIDPWLDVLYPRLATSGEVNMMEQKAVFFSPFFHYKEKNYTVNYLGKETVEGTDCHKLELVKSEQNKEIWYLKTEDYLPYKYTSFWTDFAWPLPCETYFDDFRTEQGITFPHYIERIFGTRNRQMIIENIEINPELDRSILNFPPSEAMQKLQFLEGEWDVEVFMRTRSGAWYPRPTVSSDIHFTKRNLLEQDLRYDLYLVADKKLTYNWSDKDSSYIMTCYNGEGSEMQFFTGQLNDTALIFTEKHIQADTSKTNGRLQRYLFDDIKENEFTLLIQASPEGNEWGPREKFIFRRKEN